MVNCRDLDPNLELNDRQKEEIYEVAILSTLKNTVIFMLILVNMNLLKCVIIRIVKN